MSNIIEKAVLWCTFCYSFYSVTSDKHQLFVAPHRMYLYCPPKIGEIDFFSNERKPVDNVQRKLQTQNKNPPRSDTVKTLPTIRTLYKFIFPSVTVGKVF